MFFPKPNAVLPLRCASAPGAAAAMPDFASFFLFRQPQCACVMRSYKTECGSVRGRMHVPVFWVRRRVPVLVFIIKYEGRS